MKKEKFNLENFPTSNSAKKMLSYVSDGFYDESYVGKWIYQVMGLEYDKALEMVEDLPAQFFPETATWGLMYHEIKWGLPVRENLSYEERRKQIYKKRDHRAPMTPYHMERHLEAVTGFKVNIADINDPGNYGFSPSHPNVFKVFLIGEGTLDSKAVHSVIDHLKQSHTAYILNDRLEMMIDYVKVEKIFLRKVRFAAKMPFLPSRSYDGTSRYDGKTRYDARRRYEIGASLGIHCRMEESEGHIGNLAIWTRRNIQHYDGKLRYNGNTKYNALIRKDVVE